MTTKSKKQTPAQQYREIDKLCAVEWRKVQAAAKALTEARRKFDALNRKRHIALDKLMFN